MVSADLGAEDSKPPISGPVGPPMHEHIFVPHSRRKLRSMVMDLTPARRRVLDELLRGKDAASVARALGLATVTIHNYPQPYARDLCGVRRHVAGRSNGAVRRSALRRDSRLGSRSACSAF